MSEEGPDEELQKAVFSALTEGAAVLAALAGVDAKRRVYDEVPTKYVLPYIHLGEVEIIDDSNCGAAWEAFVTTHCFSEEVGYPIVKRIGAAIGSTLNAQLRLPGFICTEWQFRNRRYFREGDGLTKHGVILHRYLIDRAPT